MYAPMWAGRTKPMPAIASIRDLHKAYGANSVLKGVEFQLESGRFYALVGKNGAGKSTLLRLLARAEFADSGSGQVLGEDIFRDRAGSKQRVAFVSETLQANVPLRAEDFAQLYATDFPHWEHKKLAEIADSFQLDLGRNLVEYSRGQRMQFFFALACAQQPQLLLLDEITSVLDARVRSLVMQYLRSFCQNGGTVLLATNIVAETQNCADRLLLLEAGKVVANSPVEDLADRYVKARTAQYREPPPHSAFLGVNADGSFSYIFSAKTGIPAGFELPDRRQVTSEDLFIYFSKVGLDL